MVAKADVLSRELARELGQLPEWRGTHWLVPSATRDLIHRVDIGVDGALLCRCEDAYYRHNEDCRHVRLIREFQEVHMPVRELTERPTIPRLGKIHLGVKEEKNGREYPVNKPYFVVPEEVAEVYGPEPTELKVVFLSDDLELIASQYYRAYTKANGLICRGDGYNADAVLDTDALQKSGGELNINAWAHGNDGRKATTHFTRQQIHCAGAGVDGEAPCPMFAAKKCAFRNFIQFAIKDVPGLGVYQMDTGSIISTRQINGAIEMARVILGGVRGVPCVLRRLKREVSPDGVKKGVWMVELEIDTNYGLANLIELRNGPVSRVLLPPVDESEVYEAASDEDDVDEEPPALPPAAEASAEPDAEPERLRAFDPPPPEPGDVRNTPAMQAAKRERDAVLGTEEPEELPFAKPEEHDDAWYRNAARLNHTRLKMTLPREVYEKAADEFSVRFTPDSDPRAVLAYWLLVEKATEAK